MADTYICENSCIFSVPKINTNKLYTPEYFKNYYEELVNEQTKMHQKLISFLRKYLKTGSVLDYGCGIGTFLINLEKEGYKNNIGIDVSEYSISIAKSKSSMSNFFTSRDLLDNKKFDCISFIDSVAHIEDINDLLSKLIKDNLTEKGIVLIRTPNINSLYVLYVRFIGYFLPKRFISSLFFVPNRLFLFNKKSIKLFLEKHGLWIEDYYIEPEYKRISSNLSDGNYIKSLLVDLFRMTIPSILNKNNSITLIARQKK
tara:strand:+ start:574 stop:1347 length:774 start_codon:yes stop_codon:yes gene_type:complete